MEYAASSIFLVVAACLLGSSCVAKQSQEAAPHIWNNADQSGLTPPPLKLDPVLRRALLRALTQLELEAQRKATGADITASTSADDPLNDSQEENIKRDLDELLGNYGNTIKTSEEKQPAKDNPDTIVLDEQNSQPADQVSVIDYEVPGDKTKSPDDPKRQETTSFLNSPQDSAIFFQDQQKESEKETAIIKKTSETEIPTQIDIQSNVIPSSIQLADTDKANSNGKTANEQDSNAIETSLTGNNAVAGGKDLAINNGGRKLDVEDQDVSIFQAPLVAAFTLQQDEKGNPKSVVPLLRRPQPSLLIQQQQQQQQQQSFQQQQFQHINPPNRFPTLPTDQQHRFQPQTVHPAGQQPLFQQQPLQLRDQQLRFQPQPFQITRQQELERQTRLLEQQLLQLQNQQRFQQQQQLEQERQRQRQQQLLLEEQQRLRLQQTPLLPLEPPVQPQRQRPQRQETGTSIVDFQQSVGFQFRQQPNNLQPQQFVPSTFHQGSNLATDFALNNFNRFRQPVQPPSVNSQLQNLLYQSGVAGDLQINGASPQEDLNIVSKILSLNHEGRDSRASRETIQTPSRFISPPLP